jgi:hypothetical protein
MDATSLVGMSVRYEKGDEKQKNANGEPWRLF